MTYLSFLLVFLGLPLAAVGAVVWRHGRHRGAGRWASAGTVVLLAHALLAITYTTPWDNYLLATRVWAYAPARVLGVTLGWVPLEEYAFFVLQTLLTGLVVMGLARRLRPEQGASAGRWLRPVALSVLAGLWLAAVLTLALGWRPGTYLALELAWSLPPIELQLAAGGHALWRRRRAVLAALALTTLYLCAADFVAIRVGVWAIDPRQSLNVFLGGGLPIEEAVFFLLTNTLMVFGVTLARAPEMSETVEAIRGRLVRLSWLREVEDTVHG